MIARMPDTQRCPSCGSSNLASVQTTATDCKLLECESCGRAYAVKVAPDGSLRLVAV